MSYDRSPKKESSIHHAIAQTILRSTNIEVTLSVILHHLISRPDGTGGRTNLMTEAVIMLRSHQSNRARFDLIKRLLENFFYRALQSKKNSNEHKVAKHSIQLFNAIRTKFDNTNWIRNLAAHGVLIDRLNNGDVRLSEPIYDGLKVLAFQQRRPEYADGLTASQIEAESSPLNEVNRMFGQYAYLLQLLLTENLTPKYLAAATALSRELKIQPPHLRSKRGGS
jgi:hypothetical protein